MKHLAEQNKELVWKYWQNLTRAQTTAVFAADLIWHGFQPLRQLNGREAVWQQVWQPLQAAMPDLWRRPYHFIGGQFEGNDWVCGTGDFVGTFAQDWLLGDVRIPACGSSVHFRFGELCRVENGRIQEIRCLIDLPDLLRQVGIQLLPPSYGRDLWVPGLLAGDGVCLTKQDEMESAKPLNLVETMIFGDLNKYDGYDQASQELEQFWHPHMMWHGSLGTGSAYGLGEFKQNGQGPIVNAFPDRKGVGHQARLADGTFAASTGWPSLAGTYQQQFMDLAANERAYWLEHYGFLEAGWRQAA